MFEVNLSGDDDNPEYALVESTGAGAVPGWDEEQEAVFALESALVDFHYLLDGIHDAGGMSQQFAMEAHRLIPDMDQKYPLGYFTKEVTGTMYRPALEEIHSGVWALIGAAALAISAMIFKFVRWITKKRGGGAAVGGSSSVSAAPTKEEIDTGIKEATAVVDKEIAAHDAIAEASKAAGAPTPAMGEAVLKDLKEMVAAQEKAPEKTDAEKAADIKAKLVAKVDLTTSDLHSFEQAADVLHARLHNGVYEDLMNQTNNAWYDIAIDGPWTKMMLSLGPILLAMESELTNRVAIFHSFFTTNMTDGDQVKKSKALELMRRIKESLPTGVAAHPTLETLAAAIVKEKSMMAVNTSKKRLEVIVATERIGVLMFSPQYKSLDRNRKKFVESLGNLYKIQIDLQEVAAKWNRASPAQGVGMGVPEEMSDEMAPAMHALMRDITYLMQVQTGIEVFLDSVDRFHQKTIGWWDVTWRIFDHLYKGQKEPRDLPVDAIAGMKWISMIRSALGLLPWSK